MSKRPNSLAPAPRATAAKPAVGPRRRNAPLKKHDAARIEEIFRRFARGASRPEGRTRLYEPLHAAGRCGVVGAGDRRRRQQGDAGACSRSPIRRRKCSTLGEDKIRELIKTIGLYRTKAKHVDRAVAAAGRGIRRRRAAGPRGAGVAAGRRPQDRQCGDEHRLRRADRSRSTRIFSASQTAFRWRRARRRSRSSAALRAIVPAILQDARASLADPARTLCLQGAPARMRALPHRRSMRLSGQERVRLRPGLVRSEGRTGQKAVSRETPHPIARPARRPAPTPQSPDRPSPRAAQRSARLRSHRLDLTPRALQGWANPATARRRWSRSSPCRY